MKLSFIQKSISFHYSSKRFLLLTILLLTSFFFTVRAQADPQWTLTWSDEFNGANGSAPDPTKWTYDTGINQPNGEVENYTNSTNNSYMDGSGHLVIQALDPGGNNGAMGSYTSARLKTQGLFNQAYGKIEASMQLPQGGTGIWPAFWMLGQNIGSVGWPTCGEIDMMEDGLPWSNTIIGGHMHGPVGGGDYNGGAGIGTNVSIPSGTVNSGFHTYGCQWSPNQVQFYVDGNVYQTMTPANMPGGGTWVFNHPFFIILNLAIGGISGSPTGSSFPQQMLVDYVRVYKLTDNGTSPYGGTAATIPGTIQAENYDTYNDGNDPAQPGSGFAYNALSATNTSGQYRTGESMSIEACSDTGGTYDVDYTSPGQWLQYTINVTQTGTYNLDARVASSGQGGTFHFMLDGNAIGSEMTCPNTGGWQNYQDVVTNVGNINAGQHVLLLVEDTMGAGNAGVCNFNYINLSLVNPPTPTPTFTPVVSSSWRVVAGGPAHTDCNSNNWAADENFSGGTAATTSNTITNSLPCSSDQALYQDQRYGASFNYSFNVPAGSYQVTLKFAETYSGDFAKGDRVFNVAINGATVLSNLDVYGTVGANTALDEVINNIAPSGGLITIQFTGTSSADTNADISAIQIISQPATPTPTWTVPACNTTSSTLGNTAAGTGGYNLAGQLNCARYTLSQPMTVTSMQIYMGAGTAGNGVLGIYADSASGPGGLLVQSNAQSLNAGWNYFVVPSTVLQPGNYWLSGSFTGNAVFEYSSSTGGQMDFETYAYTGSLPNAVGSTTGYGWLMSIYASGCSQPTVTPTRSPTVAACGSSSTVYFGSDTSNLAWTNCNAPTSAPPADGSGNAWNTINYNTSTATGWIAAEVLTSIAGGWTQPCSIAGSGITPNWISVIPSAFAGNGPCNGTNGQLYYYAKYFTIPAGNTVTSASLLITGDDGTSGGGTEPFGIYVNGNAISVASLTWSACTTLSIPAAYFHSGNNIITFMDENETGGQGIAYQLSCSLGAYTCTPTNTITNTPTLTPTQTPTPTHSSTPSATFTTSATSTYTASPTSTFTNAFTFTSTFTASPTKTFTLSPTATYTNSNTATATYTNSATSSATFTSTPTLTSSFTITNTPVGSWTPVNTATATVSSTFTNSATSTATLTNSFTPTLTPSATNTLTFTNTVQNTATNTPVNTGTFTNTSTKTATPTMTNSFTATNTGTNPSTPTSTYSFTPTTTRTPTSTWTNTPTSTLTSTPSFTQTPIPTATATSTATRSYTPTFSPTGTSTATATHTQVPPTATPTTASGCSGIPNWNGNFVVYTIGQKVDYNGEVYQCIQSHTSESNWMPPAVPALWKDLGACGAVAPALAVASPVVYPNPATSSTVNLQLPVSNATNVTIQVYTVAFREVKTINVPQVIGNSMTISLIDKVGVQLADGLYYFVIQVNGHHWTNKVLVLR
jgi:beta-glucanase (GH16 family)